MKKLSVVSLVVVFVLALTTGAFAAQTITGNVGSIDGSFDVDLNILQYAELTIPDEVDFGDIDLNVDYGEKVLDVQFGLKSNNSVWLTVESRGFEHGFYGPNSTLNSWVGYFCPLLTTMYQSGSFNAGDARGNRCSYTFSDPHGVWDSILKITFNPSGEVDADNFYQVRSGEYTDVVTFTVSAAAIL